MTMKTMAYSIARARNAVSAIDLNPPGDGDDQTPEQKAAAEAAAKEASEKAAKEASEKAAKEAADKVAAEKAAAEKDKLAAEELEKKKRDGSLTDTEAKLLKEIMDRKAKQKEMEDRLKAFEGLNADEVRKLLDEKKAAEKKIADEALAAEAAKGNAERVRQLMAEAHEKEKKELQEQLDALRAQTETSGKVIETLTVGAAFDGSAFVREGLILTPAKARQIYGSHFDTVDGKIVAFDKPRGEKDRTALVDASGKNLGFEDAMKKIVDLDPEKDSLLRSKMANGSGSRPSVKGDSVQKQTSLTGIEKITAGLNAGALAPKK